MGYRRKYRGRRRNTPRKTVTRAKWQRKTPRVNRSLILANARVVSRLDKIQRSHITTLDYALYGTLLMETDGAGNSPWSWMKLTDYTTWGSVLRGNPLSEEENSTVVSGMKISFRCNLGYQQLGAFLQVFLVSPTKEHPDFDPESTDISAMPRVYSPTGPWMAGKFNPDAVHVHKMWTKSLTPGTMSGDVPVNGPFTPNVIWSKSHYRKLGWKVHSPLNRAWKDVDFFEQSVNRQLWLVGQVVTSMNTEPANYGITVCTRMTCRSTD